VNIGVVYNVIKAQVMRDLDILETHEDLAKSILNSPLSPNDRLKSFTHHSTISSSAPKTMLYSVPDVG